MSRANQSPSYSLLGRFYDQLVPEGPAMNRHVRRKLLGHLLRRPDTVCDLGCGTGTTAVELAQAGHKVYAVDASAEQCRQATRKIRAAKVKVRVIQADLRRVRLPEPVGLVLCEFNPLNHLGRKEELEVAFRNVARALRPGGWFCFDLNMSPTYVKLSPMTLWEEGDGFCVVMRGGVNFERRFAWLDLDWFIQERTVWRRYHERIEDTWWSNSEIQAALRRAGFGHVQAWDGARVRPRKMKARRGFDRYYLARRNT